MCLDDLFWGALTSGVRNPILEPDLPEWGLRLGSGKLSRTHAPKCPAYTRRARLSLPPKCVQHFVMRSQTDEMVCVSVCRAALWSLEDRSWVQFNSLLTRPVLNSTCEVWPTEQWGCRSWQESSAREYQGRAPASALLRARTLPWTRVRTQV